MNKREVLDKYQLKPVSYKKRKKVDIITTKDARYVLKPSNNQNIYDYLKIRNFTNFAYPLTESDDNYEITEYIDDIDVPDEQRIEDLIYLTSILHTKTTFYKNVDVDYIKKIYEEQLKLQEQLYNYYSSLQDMIETEVYMSPSHYLLIRNISDIYKCIIKSKDYINKWYELVKEQKKIRYTMTHGNLDKSHLIENNEIYLISWDKARINLPVYDLASIYKNNQEKIDPLDLLEIYQSKYELKEDEKCLLLSMISLPPKLKINDNEYENVKETLKVVEYTIKIRDFLWESTPQQ